MFDDRIEAAGNNYPADWGIRIYDLMFKDTKARMLDLPENFFEVRSTISIGGFNGTNWTAENLLVNNLGLGTSLPFPESVDMKSQGLATSDRWGGYMLDADNPRWDTIKAEYLTYVTAYHEVVAKQTAFKEGVRTVITTYTTLSPALKAWPPLWDLIPPVIKERHNRIVERKKPQLDAVEIDLNSLTAVVTLDKLTK